MNSMLFGLLPLLIVATWGACYVLLERALYFRAPATQIVTALLCVGFCLAAIAALAWAMPQQNENWSDAPLGRIVRHGPTSLDEPMTHR
jgi:hypothetical protein